MHQIVQPTYCIKDVDYNELNDPGKKFLSIELSLGGFSYCILDTDRFRYVALESYDTAEQTRDYHVLSHALETFVKENKALTGSYQRISLAFNHPMVTLVPDELFSHSQKKKYVDFNTYPQDEYELRVDKLNNLSAHALYPFPKVLNQKINFLFPGCRVRHTSTCLIENILYMVRYGRVSSQLVLHVQKDHFEILVFDGEMLSFYNSFGYQTWDDLFYYLFYVLEQLGLQAENLDVMLYGEVGIDTEFYRKVRLYFKTFSFGPRNDLYKYSVSFDDIPHHYFYNLLNINACG